MQEPAPKPVEHAIIVDFSNMDNSVRPAAKSKRSASPSATKPKPTKQKPAPKSKSTPSKSKATAPLVQKVVEEVSEVVAVKKETKPEEEKPKGPTAAEIAAAKKAKEKADKKSKFSAMLSQSTKKSTGESDDADDGDTKGDTDEGRSQSNGHSNIRGVLGNRKVLKVPTIKDDSQKKGRVVVKICVDAKGDVVSSNYTMMGSTTSDTYLIKLAEKGALGYQFSPSKNPKECGKVVIDFLLK